MLRHFIAASVIVLTSSFLIFELVASDRAMSAYLRYIVQKADSSFLYDKYQNQSIAAHVMRALAAEQSEVSPEQRRAICEAFESANNTHGLNLTAHKYPGLRGTLQTASTDCDTIVEFETEVLDTDNFQGNAVINYTDRETPYTRIIEHKHFEFGTQEKTVITRDGRREISLLSRSQ